MNKIKNLIIYIKSRWKLLEYLSDTHPIGVLTNDDINGLRFTSFFLIDKQENQNIVAEKLEYLAKGIREGRMTIDD